MNSIVILEPVFLEKIWGGEKLHSEYKYELPSNKVGECLAISAHPSGDCKILNTDFKGNTLSWLWAEHRELFGNVEAEQFPILIKILDACDDLSVQVHPNNQYANIHENQLGKAECWYVLKANENKNIVMGHHAQKKEQLEEAIYTKQWDSLLNITHLSSSDFFYIPPGTIHAILKGTLIYEVQQSSDVTYRLYDYDREDDEGNKRQLHIKKAIDVITVPYVEARIKPRAFYYENLIENEYIKCEYFTVKRWLISGVAILWKNKPFLLMSVLQGQGIFNNIAIKKGMHFIVLADVKQMVIKGNIVIMVSHL